MKKWQIGAALATLVTVSFANAGAVNLGAVTAGASMPFGIGGMAVIGALALIAGAQLIGRRNK